VGQGFVSKDALSVMELSDIGGLKNKTVGSEENSGKVAQT